MKKRGLISPVVWLSILLLCGIPGLIYADYWGDNTYTQEQNWEDSDGYTRQCWGFNSSPWDESAEDNTTPYIVAGDGFAPDYAMANTYGGAYFTRTDFTAAAWAWIENSIMNTESVNLQGMLGGMGNGTFDFKINVRTPSGYTQDVWIQYVAIIPNDSDETAMSVRISSTSDFSNSIGTLVNKEGVQLTGPDISLSSGKWWRVTELWQVKNPEDVEYIQVATATTGIAQILDSVDIITRAGDIQPPEVSETTPLNSESDVSLDSAICLTFSKGMDTESVENAFSITPADSGTLSWSSLNSVLTFTPDMPLSPSTTYQVKVDTGAQDSSGIALAQAFELSFATEAYTAPVPEVSNAPTGTVSEDTATITIGGNGVFGYRYSLDAGAWSDICDPSDALALTDLADGNHTLELQVMDGYGNWTDLDDVTWTVVVLPTVASTYPVDNGSLSVTGTMTITFSEAMDPDTAKGAFSITPEVGGTLSWAGAGQTTLVFTPGTALASESQYTVTIAATAADAAGNTLLEAYSFTFTTLAANIIQCDVSADTYVLFGGMGGGVGYPQGTSQGQYRLKAGAVSLVDARILMRFDLTPLTDIGLTAEDVVSAKLVYTMLTEDDDASMDVGPPASAGTTMYGFIYVLDPDTCEYTGDTVEPFYWTEDVQGDGYVDMENKPWYVSGAPTVLAGHSTGPDTVGRVDISSILKGWLSGLWENNGIELKDQDDQSDPDSEYGDGYSWHLASREDADQAPVLEVIYDTDQLRIVDRAAASESLASGESRQFEAGGGDSSNYKWQATAPDGTDISAAALSTASGSTTTFTAPSLAGIVTITLTSGTESDQVFIGIGTQTGPSQAPLYLSSDTTEEEAACLAGICENLLDEMGQFASFTRICINDNGDGAFVGGTGQNGGAEMTIGVIDNPARQTTPVDIILDTLDGKSITVTISFDDVTADVSRIYIAAVDTGGLGPGGASGIYLFELYDENGDVLNANTIGALTITLPYDKSQTGSSPFTSGAWGVGHADDYDTFLSGDTDSGISTIPQEDFEEVDETNQTVSFNTTHCSAFGLVSGSGEGWTTTTAEDESLGGGCFIGSLFYQP